MIEIRGLQKRYGEFVAIPDLTLKVESGEIFGFLGPNGAGKTTTIRILMGILTPSAGQALVDGLDCQKDSVEVKRRVGYLPDTPTFYDYLRGREIVEFVAEMHGLNEARAKVTAILGDLGLAEAADEYAINYSLGMKKKLALACALIHDPPVLILDEPTNGLDPRAAREIVDRLKERANRGLTVFLSTHLLEMADKVCTRVGILHGGRLMAVGPPAELREQLAQGGSLEQVFLDLTASQGDAAP